MGIIRDISEIVNAIEKDAATYFSGGVSLRGTASINQLAGTPQVTVRKMTKSSADFGLGGMSLVTNEDGIPVPYTDNTVLRHGGRDSTPISVGAVKRDIELGRLQGLNSMRSAHSIKGLQAREVSSWRDYIKARDQEIKSYAHSLHIPRDGYEPGLYPTTRPTTGPLSDHTVYSDRGDFFKVVLPGGRTTTIYLRNSGTPNLGIPSEGWTPQEADDIAAVLFASGRRNVVDSRGTVAGATPEQVSREILGHDQLHRRTPTHNFFDLNWADWITQVAAKTKKEKSPFAVADIRGLPRDPGIVQRAEQMAISAAVNRAVKANDRGVLPMIVR